MLQNKLTSFVFPVTFIREGKKLTLEHYSFALGACFDAATAEICTVVAAKPGLIRQVLAYSLMITDSDSPCTSHEKHLASSLLLNMWRTQLCTYELK